MSVLAISLVMLSALFHALWNFVAKKAHGGPVFVWAFGVLEVFIFLPFVVYLIVAQSTHIDFTGLLFLIGSALIHLAYFVLLIKGYQVGALSVVYPLARAIGPFIATIIAILVFGERPTLLAFIGAVLICGGVFGLTGDPRKLRDSKALPGIIYAFYTGLAIAAYTLWDSVAVSQLLIAPLIFQWGSGAIRVLFLTPYALRHWDSAIQIWHDDKWKAGFVAIFSTLSYLLILLVLVTSPVSYVAPMRVVSTLIGVGLGVAILKEEEGMKRLGAALVMVLGVFALSIG